MKQLALLVTLLAFDATYMQPKAELLNRNNDVQKISAGHVLSINLAVMLRRRAACRPDCPYR